jgi:hypothetical protein
MIDRHAMMFRDINGKLRSAPICAEHTEALTLAQYHSMRCLVDE